MAVAINKKSDVESKIQFLRRVPIFGGVDEDNLIKMAHITSEKTYSKKNIVFHEGDYGDALYVIKSGRIKIAKVAIDGREKTLTILKAGDFFGEMSLVDGKPRSASVRTVKPSAVIVIERKKIFDQLIVNPEIYLRILDRMSFRLRDFDQKYIQDILRKNKEL